MKPLAFALQRAVEGGIAVSEVLRILVESYSEPCIELEECCMRMQNILENNGGSIPIE